MKTSTSLSGVTYDSRNSKLVLLSVLEETEDVITDDDAGLAGQLLENTHDDDLDRDE